MEAEVVAVPNPKIKIKSSIAPSIKGAAKKAASKNAGENKANIFQRIARALGASPGLSKENMSTWKHGKNPIVRADMSFRRTVAGEVGVKEFKRRLGTSAAPAKKD